MSIAGKKIGIALSGGGYRAAAYHIGTLRALHRLGVLDKVDVISSVSGGSITAAYYALNKDNYEDFEKGFIKSLSKGVLWSSFLYVGIAVLLLLGISVAMGHLTAYGTSFSEPPDTLGCLCRVGWCHCPFPSAHPFPETFICHATDKQAHLTPIQ